MPANDDPHAVSDDLACARSLRASQARRQSTARRRRRALRGKGMAIVASGVLLTGGGGAAFAATGGATPGKPAKSSKSSSSSKKKKIKAHAASTIKAVQEALGLKADGVNGPKTRSAIKRFQRKNRLKVDGKIGPATLKALGITGDDEAPTAGGPVAPVPPELAAQLEKIAQCESAGDPTAVSPSGQYRGKYQFDQPTWESMGGTGDPAAAPEATQDSLAAKLLASKGPGAWPNCA